MRIAVLSSEFPPRLSGVGDHTEKLAQALSEKDEVLAIWTAETRSNSPFKIHVILHPWGWRNFFQFLSSLNAFHPDSILLQYTPQSLAPKRLGVWLSLPLWVWLLKTLVRSRVVILFHELNYPVELTPRGIVLGIPQFLQYLFLVSVSDFSFFATEMAFVKTRRFFFWKKTLAWLPVGSAISVASVAPVVPVLTTSFRKKRLLHFGGLHPTHSLDHLLAAHRKVTHRMGVENVELVFVGVTQEEVQAALKVKGIHEIPEGIVALGRLSESEVSQCLQSADLILAPFTDGISTRRSTVMACLAHGKPILTTYGSLSQGSTPWSTFCCVVPVAEMDEYAEQALRLLLDLEALADLGRKAKGAYDLRFSWSRLAQEFILALREGLF